MIGYPHLAQLVGHRHGDQVGTPLPAHSSGVSGHCLFCSMVVLSSSLMVIGWLQRFAL